MTETAESLLEGEDYQLDNSGCCPVLKKVCDPDKCQVQEECSDHLVKIPDPSTINSCCPKFKCGKYCENMLEMHVTTLRMHVQRALRGNIKSILIFIDIPRDKCVYTMKNEGDDSVVVKRVNETWSDGACRRCKCYASKPTKDCPGNLYQ